MLVNRPAVRKGLSVIYSLEGLTLNPSEKSLFQQADPAGFILFGRNIESPEQLRRLTDDLRTISGDDDLPILIDQEGGRVARLKPPQWPDIKDMRYFGTQIEVDQDCGIQALVESFFPVLEALKAAGINVNCVPVLDVLFEETHDAIGDRAFSFDPDIVGIAGQALSVLCLENDIRPVMKHMPGHGRAMSDSHHDLPCVKAELSELRMYDFYPFKTLAQGHKDVWGMMAHVIYEAIDPDYPASISRKIISDIIRGEIGFKGLLLSDDLSMKALDPYGEIDERAELCLRAGCDLALYCAGALHEMEKIANRLAV